MPRKRGRGGRGGATKRTPNTSSEHLDETSNDNDISDLSINSATGDTDTSILDESGQGDEKLISSEESLENKETEGESKINAIGSTENDSSVGEESKKQQNDTLSQVSSESDENKNKSESGESVKIVHAEEVIGCVSTDMKEQKADSTEASNPVENISELSSKKEINVNLLSTQPDSSQNNEQKSNSSGAVMEEPVENASGDVINKDVVSMVTDHAMETVEREDIVSVDDADIADAGTETNVGDKNETQEEAEEVAEEAECIENEMDEDVQYIDEEAEEVLLAEEVNKDGENKDKNKPEEEEGNGAVVTPRRSSKDTKNKDSDVTGKQTTKSKDADLEEISDDQDDNQGGSLEEVFTFFEKAARESAGAVEDMDNMSLEEISDDDLDASKKDAGARKSRADEKASKVVKSPGAAESKTDPELKPEVNKEEDTENKDKEKKEEKSSTEQSSMKRKLSPDKAVDKNDSSAEPAFYTGLGSAKRPRSETNQPIRISSDRNTDQNARSTSSGRFQRTADISCQTERRVCRGKIVQCSINLAGTQDFIGSTISEDSQLLEKFKSELPTSISEKIFTDVTRLHAPKEENTFSFQLGPVTLSDMDSVQFREVLLRGAKHFNLAFDGCDEGIFKAQFSKQTDLVSLLRDLKGLEMGNRYMVLNFAYRPTSQSKGFRRADLWEATLVLMYEQDIQAERQSIKSDGKVRAKMEICGVPQNVSKDFVQVLFPEALSITSGKQSENERSLTLGFSCDTMAKEISSCYDLVVINGSKVTITENIELEAERQEQIGYEEVDGIVIVPDILDLPQTADEPSSGQERKDGDETVTSASNNLQTETEEKTVSQDESTKTIASSSQESNDKPASAQPSSDDIVYLGGYPLVKESEERPMDSSETVSQSATTNEETTLAIKVSDKDDAALMEIEASVQEHEKIEEQMGDQKVVSATGDGSDSVEMKKSSETDVAETSGKEIADESKTLDGNTVKDDETKSDVVVDEDDAKIPQAGGLDVEQSAKDATSGENMDTLEPSNDAKRQNEAETEMDAKTQDVESSTVEKNAQDTLSQDVLSGGSSETVAANSDVAESGEKASGDLSSSKKEENAQPTPSGGPTNEANKKADSSLEAVSSGELLCDESGKQVSETKASETQDANTEAPKTSDETALKESVGTKGTNLEDVSDEEITPGAVAISDDEVVVVKEEEASKQVEVNIVPTKDDDGDSKASNVPANKEVAASKSQSLSKESDKLHMRDGAMVVDMEVEDVPADDTENDSVKSTSERTLSARKYYGRQGYSPNYSWHDWSRRNDKGYQRPPGDTQRPPGDTEVVFPVSSTKPNYRTPVPSRESTSIRREPPRRRFSPDRPRDYPQWQRSGYSPPGGGSYHQSNWSSNQQGPPPWRQPSGYQPHYGYGGGSGGGQPPYHRPEPPEVRGPPDYRWQTSSQGFPPSHPPPPPPHARSPDRRGSRSPRRYQAKSPPKYRSRSHSYSSLSSSPVRDPAQYSPIRSKHSQQKGKYTSTQTVREDRSEWYQASRREAENFAYIESKSSRERKVVREDQKIARDQKISRDRQGLREQVVSADQYSSREKYDSREQRVVKEKHSRRESSSGKRHKKSKEKSRKHIVADQRSPVAYRSRGDLVSERALERLRSSISPISVPSKSRSLSPVSRSPSPKLNSKKVLLDSMAAMLHASRTYIDGGPTGSPYQQGRKVQASSSALPKQRSTRNSSPPYPRRDWSPASPPDSAALRRREASPKWKVYQHKRSQSPKGRLETAAKIYKSSQGERKERMPAQKAGNGGQHELGKDWAQVVMHSSSVQNHPNQQSYAMPQTNVSQPPPSATQRHEAYNMPAGDQSQYYSQQASAGYQSGMPSTQTYGAQQANPMMAYNSYAAMANMGTNAYTQSAVNPYQQQGQQQYPGTYQQQQHMGMQQQHQQYMVSGQQQQQQYYPQYQQQQHQQQHSMQPGQYSQQQQQQQQQQKKAMASGAGKVGQSSISKGPPTQGGMDRSGGSNAAQAKKAFSLGQNAMLFQRILSTDKKFSK